MAKCRRLLSGFFVVPFLSTLLPKFISFAILYLLHLTTVVMWGTLHYSCNVGYTTLPVFVVVYNFFTGCSRTNYSLPCDTKFTLNSRRSWYYDMSFCVIIRPKFQTVFFEVDVVVCISYRSMIADFWFTSIQLFFSLLFRASTLILDYPQLYALINLSVCFSIVIVLWTTARCVSEITVL